MKLIPLTQGKFAKVDDEDYDYIMSFGKWYAHTRPNTYYAARTIDKKHVKMHRLIFGVNDKKIFIDHKDGDGLNNQRSNLRVATKGQNNSNRRKKSNSYSKYLGVSKKHRKLKTGITTSYWVAYISHNNKNKTIKQFLGNKEGEIAAAKAYDEAARKYHGEFANLNFK